MASYQPHTLRNPATGRFMAAPAPSPFLSIPVFTPHTRRDPATGRFTPIPQAERTQAAAIRLEVEHEAFVAALTRFIDQTDAGFQQTIVETTLELFKRIVMRTPVLTGRARNSWHVILPYTASDTYRYADNAGKGYDGSLGAVNMGPYEAGVGTNVPYMMRLEAGWSKKAPAGMVAISLAELRGALEARVEEIVQREWDRS